MDDQFKNEIIKDFLAESQENLEQLEQELVALEQNPDDRARLASIFRTVHTIKGSCSFIGCFPRLEAVAHTGEGLLSQLRDGALRLDSALTNVLLRLVDAIRQILTAIEATGKDGDSDYGDLIAELVRLQRGDGPSNPLTVTEKPIGGGTSPAPPPLSSSQPPTPSSPSPPSPPSPPPPSATIAAAAPAPMLPNETSGGAAKESTIRVDVQLLDEMMTLVGELVLTRNQIVQFIGDQQDIGYKAAAQRLNSITQKLQNRVMKTRMQPIGKIWAKFPRMLRDLARDNGKQVRIEMYGREIELDKAIHEAIRDPLIHIVRNAVDHGIEPAQIRTARGKPAEGCLVLQASHRGGQVKIEITDDGAGIDPHAVLQKAMACGHVDADQASQLSAREAINLLFLPGVSTAEKVTNVSGRGVGLDVVKNNIERISGTVEIQSTPSEGTTISIRLPLTLAIIPALIVDVGGKRFAIPHVSVVEVVRLEGGSEVAEVEMFHGAPVYRLRGRLLTLIYLDQVLELYDSDGRRRNGRVRH